MNDPPNHNENEESSYCPTLPTSADVLEAMRPISERREFIFPHRSVPKTLMNSQSANAALKRMGYKDILTAHGMRSIVSTAMNEKGFRPDAIEAVLAHGEKNSVRAAYNRATYLEERKEMMEWWGLFVKNAASGGLTAAECIRNIKI